MRHPLHDYSSAGGYFVTFVTIHRHPMLGRVTDGAFTPSRAGEIVEETWRSLPEYFSGLVLDWLQVMPDHVHCILILTDARLTGNPARPRKGLPAIIQAFKGMSARRINRELGLAGGPVWQKGYADRVVRSEHELEKLRAYISTNPLRETLERGVP